MGIRVNKVDFNILNMKTRIPFKYGIATMTALPHLFVSIEAVIDDCVVRGISSDGLPPKWFSKNMETSFEYDLNEMFEVIKSAKSFCVDADSTETVYGFWKELYWKQMEWGKKNGYPQLLCGLGVSLMERAIIDAFCRKKKVSFFSAVKENLLGIKLEELYEELEGRQVSELLPCKPLTSILVRHTVGMADPLTDEDIDNNEKVEDGLPQTLERSILEYGLTRFKIKLCGDLIKDIQRLEKISEIIDKYKIKDFGFTLDGNEQFNNPLEFKSYWINICNESKLNNFLKHLLFVEQPLKRNVALSDKVKEVFNLWIDRPNIIIDESDSIIGSVIEALDCGYVGTSHKNCKGIIKGIANACLLEHRRNKYPDKDFILSGEDLANVGPVALLQDLTLMSILGINHVERNGHHYFRGLSMYPEDINQDVLCNHDDIYKLHPNGFPTVSINKGRLFIKSLDNPSFGLGFWLDTNRFIPLEQWKFSSL